MNDESVICTCMNICVKDIKAAIASGDKTFEEMQDRTGLGTVCGVCVDEAEVLFKQLLNEAQ